MCPSIFKRFWSKVKFTDTCWEWQGSRQEHGHGLFKYKNKSVKCHRFVLETYFDTEVPEDKVVRHLCNNPCCVNPLHLAVGTQKDNVRDREVSNRSNRRTRDNTHGMAKVNTHQIKEMIHLKMLGYKVTYIASKFNIHKTTAHKLIKEYTKDVT